MMYINIMELHEATAHPIDAYSQITTAKNGSEKI